MNWIVDRLQLEDLLRAVAEGTVSSEAALDRIGDIPIRGFDDLGFARVDTHRALRIAEPEVVYGAGKTAAQTLEILQALIARSPEQPALGTRLDAESLHAIEQRFPDARLDTLARCALVGRPRNPLGRVCVVSAGTSDTSVAAEASFTARAFGAHVMVINDVGVAGIHRLLAVRQDLAAADCLVVVAGMEGALPSAIAGLVGTPLIAVPTSVGYGASFGGLAALLGMLTSCAPGVTVVNIDNGFGAGLAAARLARRACRHVPKANAKRQPDR